MSFKDDAFGIGVVAVGAWLAYQYIKEPAGAVVQAINPVNQNNIAYRGANAVVQSASGDESMTVGTGIYDAVHWVGNLDAMQWVGDLF